MEEKHAGPDEGIHQPLYGMTATRQAQLARRRVCVCVDDYGLHEGINLAALDLARLGRISAVSCLVDGPAWLAGAKALKQNEARLETGLHLNFTEDFGQNLVVQPLPRLILLAYAHRLDRAALKQDIRRQLDHFESAMARMPDFIDGHQHVHQLPVIRNVLLDVLNERYQSDKPWLRATHPPRAWTKLALPPSVKLKSWFIGRLGASALGRLAKQSSYWQNNHLLGVYGFDVSEKRYLHNLKVWFEDATDGDVLMCHPSLPGARDDPLLSARNREYKVLSSDAFLALTKWAKIKTG